MALNTFTPAIPPDVGSSISAQHRVNKAKFGDGYIQRSGDGINTKEEAPTLNWSQLTSAEATAIINFLDGQKGYIAFNYTLPGESTPKKFTCEKYSRGYSPGAEYNVSAQLERVYDL